MIHVSVNGANSGKSMMISMSYGGCQMGEQRYVRSVLTVQPEISIIVPVYHGEKFIQQCLDSIYSQTYENYIVYIVLDDFSYDNTFSIIERHPLYSMDKIVVIASICKSNPANARNRALDYVHTDYVCFLDVDDTWEPDKLARQIEYHTGGVFYITFTTGLWHRDFGTFLLESSERDYEDHMSACMFIWSSVMMDTSVCTVLYERDGMVFDETWPQCDDGEMLIRAHEHGFKFGVLNMPLVHVYEHGGNLTQGNLWAPNYWAAKTWWKYGYRWNAMRHICMGILAVVSEWLHIRKYLRKWRMKLNGAVEV